MYFQPYGNGQQLNLNWIINEIIELHKQLDPEYETPSFSQIYPYSNLNQLNLDWILSELKTLKELAPEPVPTEVDIQAVAEALVALPFDSSKSYQIFDYISRDGEIWRAKEAIPAGSAWDGSKWFKTKLGIDLAVLERWINAINASLTMLENTVDELSSADISDDSDAGGTTVKASLNNLKGSLNSLEGMISAWDETGNTTASRAYAKGSFLIRNGYLYITKTSISQGESFSSNNIASARIGEHLSTLEYKNEQKIAGANLRAIKKGFVVNFTGAVGVWRVNPDATGDLADTMQVSTDGGTTWLYPQLLEEMRPPFNVETVDANTNNRVTIRSDGYFGGTHTGNANLRFSGCWIAASAL